MKKLVNYILVVTTSLLFLSCEKEKYPGAYPFKEIRFINKSDSSKRVVLENDSSFIINPWYENWNQDLFPMTLWVDDEEIATITQSGYLIGKKEGTVTIYAKVMSIYGEIEGSVKYNIKGLISNLIENFPNTLEYWGMDRNKDGIITVAEVQETEILKGYIGSDWLLEIGHYMPLLKELEVWADTTSRILDLSNYEFKKLTIHDYCFEYALKKSEDFYLYDRDIFMYRRFFFTDLIMNNSIEYLKIKHIPGFKSINLQSYTNLKTIVRETINRCDPQWSDLELILPENIENAQLFDAKINFNYVYPKLKKLKYDFQGYSDISKNKKIEINKQQLPNLKKIEASRGLRYFDLSSYSGSDIDSVYIFADTIVLSQSMYDERYSDSKTFYADYYIIK